MSESIAEKISLWVQKAFWPVVGLGVLAIVVSLGLSYKASNDYKKPAKLKMSFL